jgi:hypothetical protein
MSSAILVFARSCLSSERRQFVSETVSCSRTRVAERSMTYIISTLLPASTILLLNTNSSEDASRICGSYYSHRLLTVDWLHLQNPRLHRPCSPGVKSQNVNRVPEYPRWIFADQGCGRGQSDRITVCAMVSRPSCTDRPKYALPIEAAYLKGKRLVDSRFEVWLKYIGKLARLESKTFHVIRASELSPCTLNFERKTGWKLQKVSEISDRIRCESSKHASHSIASK